MVRPVVCLCLLWLAGCQTFPHVNPARPARQTEYPLPFNYSAVPAVANAMEAGKPIPICLDTVLRLAQDQNGQVRLARMRLDDAENDQVWANKHWLPDLSVGMGAARHEGGIQDFQGNLVKSSYGSAIG